MNIRGFAKIHSLFKGASSDSKKGNEIDAANDSNSRESNEDARRRRRQQMKLTPEQVEQAFTVLVMTLVGSGLAASKAMGGENHDEVYFVVKNPAGALVREIRGIHIVELYLSKFENQTHNGTLLSKSA